MLEANLAYTFKLAILIQLFFFLLAFLKKTDLFTDLSYGLTFMIIAFSLLFRLKLQGLIPFLAALSVLMWGLRLIIYLFIRIIIIKKDKRFDKIRNNFVRFAFFWLFQGLSIWIIMLPIIVLLSLNKTLNFNLFSILGLFIWFKGLIIETVADWQKFTFKLKSKNKNKWIDKGLWHYSRHPNYFGEMLCWWGLFVLAVSYLQGWQYLSIIGPLYITSLLIFVSGIPLLEKRYMKKYGKNKEYLKYKKQTSLLIPFLKFK